MSTVSFALSRVQVSPRDLAKWSSTEPVEKHEGCEIRQSKLHENILGIHTHKLYACCMGVMLIYNIQILFIYGTLSLKLNLPVHSLEITIYNMLHVYTYE